eukprot:SAG11_NODE_20598_length_442_cov_0.740525_1_plen_34_part_10
MKEQPGEAFATIAAIGKEEPDEIASLTVIALVVV